MKKIDEKYLEELSIIKASKHKQNIIDVLSKGNVMIPSEIGQELNLKTNHISVNLKELKEMGVIECLNEDKTKGRLYCMTDKGTNIKEFL